MVSEQQMGESATSAYEEALSLAIGTPGTVCTTRKHYIPKGTQTPQHTEPYRLGYGHADPVHWHSVYEDYIRCPDTRPTIDDE